MITCHIPVKILCGLYMHQRKMHLNSKGPSLRKLLSKHKLTPKIPSPLLGIPKMINPNLLQCNLQFLSRKNYSLMLKLIQLISRIFSRVEHRTLSLSERKKKNSTILHTHRPTQNKNRNSTNHNKTNTNTQSSSNPIQYQIRLRLMHCS